ncbi:BrnT family toxin [Sphaerotilus sp.]|uniref:BrnT family toxin n=1 Tax=Sphaerotilus sp. TaxID=2093942 RepID=UPI002ACD52C4|nr:BrnT family toxin [Sphaerotilus sp.]MDZ7856719.1 BrnT family toxin [Sphaerotilus sp.]
MHTQFEWDPEKAASNWTKHRIDFETAVRAFADPFMLTEHDRIEHGEHRWRSVGMVDGHLILFIAHTVREEEGDGIEVIRIISARKADPKERKRYEQNR